MPEIGLMGGSFNPIHCGHVALARAALESGRVERVLFLPTGNPPHKKEGLADKFDSCAWWNWPWNMKRAWQSAGKRSTATA